MTEQPGTSTEAQSPQDVYAARSLSDRKATEHVWHEHLDDVTLPPGGGPVVVEPDGTIEPPYMSRQGRDLRVDLLRGYFVLAMVIDHVRGPSPLYLITGGNRFYTSAVEGFVLASGLVTGLAYRSLIQRMGVSAGIMRALARVASLYLLTVSLTLLLLPLSEVLYLPWAQGVDLSDPLALVVSILTLHRTYHLVDVLLLYVTLFLVAPMALVLLDRGKGWVILVGTFVLWGLYQFYPQYTALPWPIAGNYLFGFSAWQILFFLGLLLGYHQDRMPALSPKVTRLAMILTGIGTVALIVAFYIIDPPTATMPSGIAIGSPVFHEARLWLQSNFFDKVDLRPGRLLTSAITFSFLFLVASVFWRRVQRWLGWLLLPLGQHAIYAYAVHIVVAAAVAALLKPLNITYPGPQLVNAAIQIASILAVWLLVRQRFLAATAHTRHLWYAASVLLAVAVVITLLAFPSPSSPALAAPRPVATQTPGEQVPRRFGTPVARANRPNTAATPGARATPAPVGAPSLAERRPNEPPVSESRLAKYAAGLQGTLKEKWFYSPELDGLMPYIVYLPPDYDSAGRRYPVLYMLHGRGGHREEWLNYGLIEIADQEIRTGHTRPMIIVLPQGDTWYWANHAGDDVLWGEYINRDLLSEVDSNYRTIRSASARAIGGLSMGAWGALHHAFLRPDLFSVVGAHSPALRLFDDSTMTFLGPPAERAKKDPFALARDLPLTNLEGLRIWLDSAQNDPWVKRAQQLHQILVDRGIDHIWQVYPGSHDYAYWREHAVDYVRFYGDALAQQ